MTTTGMNLLPIVVNRRRRRAVAMTRRGWKAHEIAREMGVSVRTVQRYTATGKTSSAT